MRLGFLALVAVMLAATPVRADDVTDQIGEALTAYKNKDVPTAIAALDAAANLLRQHRADVYGTFLPKPPGGWTADEVETVSAGLAVLGGGASASRQYHKGGDAVTVSILADSPLLQVVTNLATSAIASMAGVRTIVVNGRRTIYQKDEGSYTSIVADRILVRVEGHGQPEDVLKQFLTGVDFAGLEKAVK